MAKGMALFLTVTVAGVFADAAGSAKEPDTPRVRLKTVSSRMSRNSASLLIEVTEPAAYVTARPDPLTVILDFRNVAAAGVANRFVVSENSPITDVAIEAAEVTGAPASRVRISLTHPVPYRIRSDRNTVLVDFDKPAIDTLNHDNAAGRPRDAMAALGQSSHGAADAKGALEPRRPADAAATMAAAASASQAAAPQTAQPPQAPPALPADQPGGRRFTGNPVSLDFQGADLRAVLRTFSEISGLNIVIDPRVAGTVDVALRDVPWDQALDIILRANGLDWRVDGTIVRIAPRDVFTAEDKSRAEAAEARASAEQLTTVTRQLSYAKGDDVVRLLKETRVITKYGQAQIDPRTNTLIITDVPGQLDQVQNLINTLDTAQPQVEIEARIVQTTKSFARALGVQWGFLGRVAPGLGNTTNLAFPNNGSIGGRAGGTVVGTTTPAAVNLGVAANSAVGLALGSVNGAFNLDLALSAAEKRGDARLLSTPRVTTQNNLAAEIAQGQQIPYQTVANNTVTTQFKDAALSLKVVPQITAAGTVILNISVDNGSRGEDIPNGSNGFIPSINTQRATTTVLVNDGETTVIGGIYSSTDTTSTSRTPGLSRIPLLKWLFKNDTLDTESRELLIFLTPKIIK
jgi:type IV pilus assembly protein PilQ